MAEVVQAGLWGLVAGSALLLGAALGYGLRVPQKVIATVIATVMAFGAGVLLSAVSFELVGEAYEQAGLAPAAVGTLVGAVAYTAGNVWLARRGPATATARATSRPSRPRPSRADPGWRSRSVRCSTVFPSPRPSASARSAAAVRVPDHPVAVPVDPLSFNLFCPFLCRFGDGVLVSRGRESQRNPASEAGPEHRRCRVRAPARARLGEELKP